jgi:hypothetical protein
LCVQYPPTPISAGCPGCVEPRLGAEAQVVLQRCYGNAGVGRKCRPDQVGVDGFGGATRDSQRGLLIQRNVGRSTDVS